MVEPGEVESVFARTRAILRDTGFPPGVGSRIWWPDARVAMSQHAREDLLGCLPPHDVRDPAERAAIASLLATIPALGDHVVFETDEEVQADLRRVLRDYLRVLDVSSFSDLPIIRWEIQAAGVAQDTRRIADLAGPAQDKDPKLEYFHLVPRALFLSLIESLSTYAMLEAIWDPDIRVTPDFTFEHLDQLFGTGFACNVKLIDQLATRSSHEAMGAPDNLADIPYLCLALIQTLGPARVERNAATLAVRSWCQLAVGTLEQHLETIASAGRGYEALAKQSEIEQLAHKKLIHKAAAYCFEKSNKYQAATRNTRAWIELDPDSAAARGDLVKFLFKQGYKLEAIEAPEAFVNKLEEESPSPEGEWLNSMLLQLALEHKDKRDHAVSVEAAVLISTFRPQGQALLQWMAPWTSKLCRPAYDKWWTGLFLLSSAELHAGIGEAETVGEAGAAFGEAVKHQIRHSVADPFVRMLAEPNQSSAHDPYWTKFVHDKAALGDLIGCLLQTRAPQRAIATALQKWLAVNVPAVPDYLKKKGSDLFKLNDLRRSAQHKTVSKDELRRLYDEASSFLQVLVKGASGQGPKPPIGGDQNRQA